ncbi:hypothetical protein ACIP88_10625 [Streptomyces uncialis]|uniref:hypothetical protein n=1 Tax=Streptomyces uncialis TaxID=1048205 RepID=UPI00380B7246
MTPVAARDVPQGDELLLLMRCTGYRFNRNGVATGATAPPDEDDLAEAHRLGRPIGVKEEWAAGEIVARSVEAARVLDPDAVLSAFAAGVGGSAPRGRQILISYAWARYLAEAPQGPQGPHGVPDCGLSEVERLDVTEELVRIACGWAWNEIPARCLPDLEAAASHGLPEATGADLDVLRALLDLVAAQPQGTTPGQLERTVARAGLLARTDKYQRYGILIGLAELGVLPNPLLAPSFDRFVPRAEVHEAHRGMRGAPRSDITLPLAAWRGGVDAARAARLTDACR